MGPRYAFIGPLETMHLNADGESWPTASSRVSRGFVFLFDTFFFFFTYKRSVSQYTILLTISI